MTIARTPAVPSTHQTEICNFGSCYSGTRTYEQKFVQTNAQPGERSMANDKDKVDHKAEQDLRKQEQADKLAAEATARNQEQADKRA